MNKEKENNLIKIEGMLNFILFPRPSELLGKDDSHSFGITTWDVTQVLEGELNTDKITVKGDFPSPIDYGKRYKLLLHEVFHEKYGKQYDLAYICEDVELKNETQQRNFLSSILTPIQLEEIFNKFKNPIDIIKNHDVEKLKEVNGIGDYIANCIIDRYESNKDSSLIYIKLADVGLTPKMIQKLIKTYKNPQKVVTVVLHNPYKLTYDIDGIGFKTADNIALKAGVSPTSSYRISSYINFYLETMAQQGSSYVYARDLLLDIYDFFDGKENIFENITDEQGNIIGNNINQALEKLQEKNIIAIEDNENKSKRRIYLTKYYNLEKKIAENLIRIQNAKGDFEYSDWEESIKTLEKKQGFEFTQEQKDGIKLGLDNQVCFITGLAGSGKSTLVSGILASLHNYSFRQCALSGKAASRLQEVTGEDGSTIHRLLEYNPNAGFLRNKDNPLEEKIIILDELSLVGEQIFLCLLNAISEGTKLILLGDMGQLESIGEGNLAYDIYNSSIIPTVELTKVQRQAQKSGIITIAHEIRHQHNLFDSSEFGKFTFGELKDMHFDITKDGKKDREKVIDYFTKMYNSNIVKQDIMNIQLISPIKERGDACVFNLNEDAQEIVNPRKQYKDEQIITVKVSKDKFFEIRPNDKVMCIKNNYKTSSVNGNICPIFNGWTGIVKEISSNIIVVNFPLANEDVILEKKDIRKELILGYASTVHKCVTGDTLVYTDKGIKEIKDLKECWESTKIFNGKYMESPCAFYENPVQKCKTITTERGYFLTGLLDHGIMVLNDDGEIIRKNLSDVQENDHIILRKNSQCFGKSINLPSYLFNIPQLDVRAIEYSLPKTMSEDFAIFLGCMVADGVISRSGIKLGKKEEDYVKKFCDVVFRLFGYKATYKKAKHANMFLTEISSVHIRDFCKNINGLLPNKKDIPQIILDAPKKYQCAFLSALFEDGNINIKKGKVFDHIELTSKDKKLLYKVNMMLLNLGIQTSFRMKKQYLKKYNKNYDYYIIYIYKKDAKIFKERINFISQKNREKIKSVDCEINYSISSKNIFSIKKKLSDFINSQKIILPENLHKYLLDKNKKLTVDMLERILKCVPIEVRNSDYNYLYSFVNDIIVEKVTYLEDTFEKTYCVEMPYTHKFIQNGFCGFNCQGSSAKAVIGVIDFSTPPSMLTSQLLYTLITRAKTQCIIVGQNKAIAQAIGTDFVSDKQTFLQEFLLNNSLTKE